MSSSFNDFKSAVNFLFFLKTGIHGLTLTDTGGKFLWPARGEGGGGGGAETTQRAKNAFNGKIFTHFHYFSQD